MTPAVSVVMPVRNAARFLRAALDSVLGQTFTDFEIVVVDDDSTDESMSIVRAYTDPRIRLVQTGRHVGVGAALNAGLRAAAADLVARQDADDVSEPDRLERQVPVFRSRPALALLGTQGTIIDEAGRPCGLIDRSIEPASIRWYALLDNPFIHTSVMFRPGVVEACGGYDEQPRLSQDYALWTRILAGHEARNLPDRLVRYRVNEASVTGPLTFGTAVDDYRALFDEIVRTRVTANVTAMFGQAISSADALLLARFVSGVHPADVQQFLTVFERLLKVYRTAHREETATTDFYRTLARQYDALAFRITPPDRLRSLQVYAAALSRHPGLIAAFPWARALALTLLGRNGRRRVSQRWADAWRRQPAA